MLGSGGPSRPDLHATQEFPVSAEGTTILPAAQHEPVGPSCCFTTLTSLVQPIRRSPGLRPPKDTRTQHLTLPAAPTPSPPTAPLARATGGPPGDNTDELKVQPHTASRAPEGGPSASSVEMERGALGSEVALRAVAGGCPWPCCCPDRPRRVRERPPLVRGQSRADSGEGLRTRGTAPFAA